MRKPIETDKLMFLEVAKCASTSLRKAILIHKGIRERRSLHENYKFFAEMNAPLWTEKTVVGFIRDPWKRAMSFYCDRRIFRSRMRKYGLPRDCTFAEYLRKLLEFYNYELDNHSIPCTFCMTRGSQWVASLIVRVEHINEDWKEVQKIEPLPDLLHLRTTKKTIPWTRETIDLIAERYKEDIEFGKYIPPRPE
jgi:hypothetical protein